MIYTRNETTHGICKYVFYRFKCEQKICTYWGCYPVALDM